MTTPGLRTALIGEFVGTLILLLLGTGVVASVELLEKQANWIVITSGWAVGVALAVYVSGRLSGGHLNPAVTLGLATRGEFPWSRVLPYWAAQVAGAFCGAALMYFDYASAFADFEQKNHIVRGAMEAGKLVGPAVGGAGIFSTYPKYDGLMGNLYSEFLGTTMLLFAVRAVSDRRNAAPKGNLEPIMVGAIVWSIGLSLGGLTGYAINPARDLGPRLASALFGWGTAVFRSHGYYFWVPLVVPLAGGVVGAALYDLLIHRLLPPGDEESPPGRLSP